MMSPFLLEKIQKEFRRLRRRLGYSGRRKTRTAWVNQQKKFDTPVISELPVEALRREFESSPLRTEPDNFVLYRIVGNDLPPRHCTGQSRANIRFILDNEPAHPACEKRWIINRIADESEEQAIIKLLDDAGQPYLHIPFDLNHYRKTSWDTAGLPVNELLFPGEHLLIEPDDLLRMNAHLRRHKNLYAINNNGARNAALRDGQRRAKWILPFDGNCFFTGDGFEELRTAAENAPWCPYYVVPMARINDNERLLDESYRPQAEDEPQIVFRSDAADTFNEEIPYGRRPKVDMLWRLGVPGDWNRYKFHEWDLPQPHPSPQAGQFRSAGWVVRLASGRPHLEAGRSGFVSRGLNRNEAIIAFLDGLDERALAPLIGIDRLTYYDLNKISRLAELDSPIAAELSHRAEKALQSGPYSVTDKTNTAPSGDPHDYWHPAPYWWPDPKQRDGLPYIWRDGKRTPGTVMYEPQSERYDRTGLQQLFDNCTILALAGSAFGRNDLFEHAATLLRTWFIEEKTRMNPHLKYAQVRLGHNGNVGTGSGIIEFKDVYFFLDAVRLIARSGQLGEADQLAFSDWMKQYADWLLESSAGKLERSAKNNHGTYYDVQLGAIAAFLGNAAILSEIRNRARHRMFGQMTMDGAMPHELRRTRPRHYTAFGLSGWVELSRLLETTGENLWRVDDGNGRTMLRATQWVFEAHRSDTFPQSDVDQFDEERLVPLLKDAKKHHPGIDMEMETTAPQVFHPHCGIAPFWSLAL